MDATDSLLNLSQASLQLT
ncbi:hypothetical protein MRX96_048276 [Rhipicephalus microplus]